MGASSKEDKAIIINYAKSADPDLVRWSLHAIFNWHQPERLPGIVHLHGSNDLTLPLRYTRPDYVIKNGGHLMVFNKADEVNRILSEVLKNDSLRNSIILFGQFRFNYKLFFACPLFIH